jgi:hypothetical protein
MRRLVYVVTVTIASLACTSEIDRSVALVAAPRVLAVRAEPPESAPGAAVTYTALAATPWGSLAGPDIAWSFCSAPPALSDDSPVGGDCVAVPGDPIATGSTVTLTTPAAACRSFGPQGPPKLAGQPPSGPVSPDATGGYYQPLRLGWQTSVTVAFERLTCNPTGVSLDLAQAYRASRVANRNPRLLPIAADLDGTPMDPAAVPAGATMHFTAAWSAESAESYVTIDIDQSALAWRKERLWLAWFASGGALDRDVSQPPGEQAIADSRWRAPSTAGTYSLWTVLHDDRGGVDFAETIIGVVGP